MSDPHKLREALVTMERVEKKILQKSGYEPSPTERTIFAAARDYLALLESDAIVIRREADGNWPGWALDFDMIPFEATGMQGVLDALAESSRGGEQ